MRDISKNIRELRMRKGMTQDMLAERLFVTRQTVSNYETGRSRPDIDMLMKMADVFQTDVNAVLYGIAEPQNRRVDVRWFGVSLALCFLLGLPLLVFWEPALNLIQRGISGPKFILQLILLPLFLMLLGWTLMQGLSLLLRVRMPQFHWFRYARCALVLFLAFYFVLMLPPIVHFLKSMLVDAYVNGLSQPMALHGSFSLRPEWLNWVSGCCFLIFYKHPWPFFAVGLLLWLFGIPRVWKMKKLILSMLLTVFFGFTLFLCADSSFTLEVADPDELSYVPGYIQVKHYAETN